MKSGRIVAFLGAVVVLAAAVYVLFLHKEGDGEPGRPVSATPASPDAGDVVEDASQDAAIEAPAPRPRPSHARRPAVAPASDRQTVAAVKEPQKPPAKPKKPAAQPKKKTAGQPKPPPRPAPPAAKPVPARELGPRLVLRGEEVSQEELDELMVWGLDRDSIQGSIQERIPEFHRCYEAWLKVQPDLAGKMKVTFSIGHASEKDTNFTVTALDILDSELDHAVFEGCVLGALQDLVYEAGDGQININYPLVFRQEEE